MNLKSRIFPISHTYLVAICHACGLSRVTRIERSRRYVLGFSRELTAAEKDKLIDALHDRMTECVYEEPLSTFESKVERKPVLRVPVVAEGKPALKKISDELGLAFDDWDLDFYTKLFKEKMGRDPSDVECFDLAQSNSEHSRHWFFGGKMIIDGEEMPGTLFKIVKETNKSDDPGNNSVIAFHDNSSAIRGYPIPVFKASGKQYTTEESTVHGILTCETHNFPCGIAPFPGAETGTGGRIRDVQATGRGAHVVAGESSYCVGNLHIPGYVLPWEDDFQGYPSNMASPLQIIIDASNGASDYGNKFGEPVLAGYARSYGQGDVSKERREWIKPVMMSAGVGLLDHRHVGKSTPEAGMVVVKLGGPAFRIGMGGGAASSRLQDTKTASLDFDAVQRGDAEMENKMNRVIRACIELGEDNPILSIHDQGAGGTGNVVKEICEPAGAKVFLSRLPCGDETMSALELWAAEYQENNALLIPQDKKAVFISICERENLPFAFLGEITGTGRIVVYDKEEDEGKEDPPVDLALSDVLGKMPQKEFKMASKVKNLEAFVPPDVDLSAALDRVLRLLQVGSKRFLTTKVDRSVTGLVAQQQCVGPLHIPLADVAVISQSLFADANGAFTGVASAVGEQPIKGMINPEAMARLAVGEALTNLIWAGISALSNVKASANWMWPAKLPGEGAEMVKACKAMSGVMCALGVGVDGGKDSLSMAANTPKGTVKSPGQLALTVYAMCPDVSKVVTPDLKRDGAKEIFFIDLSSETADALGGTALAQVFNKLGSKTSDLIDTELFKRTFAVIQTLIKEDSIVAGHDRSDGGLLTTLLEMAFAGNVGIRIVVDNTENLLRYFFSEGLGIAFQPAAGRTAQVEAALAAEKIPFTKIASVELTDSVRVEGASGQCHLDSKMTTLRDVWEATSFELDQLQASPKCVQAEREGLASRKSPPYSLTYTPKDPFGGKPVEAVADAPKVAILREEGSNGDREMAAAFFASGFQVFDITTTDLTSGTVQLADFRGIVFVGGFSYGDVLDSAKGWAGVIKFNAKVLEQFEAFYNRKNTFSLGVCNGCQLMALLGWVPGLSLESVQAQPRFIHNASGRFESRFSTITVREDNKAIMLKGMEGSTLGVWVAHGEGRAFFPDDNIRKQVVDNAQAPLRYVDDNNVQTEQYPFNPNGSVDGICALSSADGRHLAMMPHPERVFRLWQWPWMPAEWASELKASPWLKLFQNAREWCG